MRKTLAGEMQKLQFIGIEFASVEEPGFKHSALPLYYFANLGITMGKKSCKVETQT